MFVFINVFGVVCRGVRFCCGCGSNGRTSWSLGYITEPFQCKLGLAVMMSFFGSTFSRFCLWIDFTSFKNAYSRERVAWLSVLEEVAGVA